MMQSVSTAVRHGACGTAETTLAEAQALRTAMLRVGAYMRRVSCTATAQPQHVSAHAWQVCLHA